MASGSAEAPIWVENMRLKGRASVRSLPPQLGHCLTPFSSGNWSARSRVLQVRQSTIGSLKVSSCPLALSAARWVRIAPSIPTTSSRSRTFTRLEDETAPLAKADDFLHPLRIVLNGHVKRKNRG